MKKNLCSIAIAAVAALLSAGCFYESPVPISPPGTLPLDTALIGAWQGVEAKDPDTATIVILGFDRTYQLVHFSAPEKKDPMWDGRMHLYFRAYPTQIGNARFMNLQFLQEAKPKYWLFRYVVEGSVLKVRSVKDGIAEGLDTSEKLRAFLEANLENKEIYDDEFDLRRILSADSIVMK